MNVAKTQTKKPIIFTLMASLPEKTKQRGPSPSPKRFALAGLTVSGAASLDVVFSALADPTRRAILSCLLKGQRTVGQLAEPFEISPSGFSKHLRVLERAGLLRQHKRGRERYCEVIVEPIDGALTWLKQYREMWSASLDSFARYAEELQGKRSRKVKK